jgi:hypothetical protein
MSKLDLVRITSSMPARCSTDRSPGFGKAGKAIQVNANMFATRFKDRGKII